MPEAGCSRRSATCIVIRPELRDSNIERERLVAGVGDQTVYWNLNANVPPRTTEHGWFDHERLVGTIAACVAPTVTSLIVPEPLWIRYWPRAVAVVLTAKAIRWVTRRPPLTVGFYAIDNLDPAERLTHPLLDSRPRLNRGFSRLIAFAIRKTTALITTRVAFGTSDAESNYRTQGFLPAARQMQVALIPEIHGTCPACFPSPVAGPLPLESRDRRVLFLGELSARKGVDILTDAWDLSGLRVSGWTLTICGTGEFDDSVQLRTKLDPSIELIQPDREEVHALLRTSRAVVLPSRRVPRWREQIGLSMLEAEAHGCALIVSDESGAARELESRANARIVAAGDRRDLAAALDALPSAKAAHPTAGDSSSAVREFLAHGKSPAQVAHA